jgi:hypothetical protein
MHYAILSSSGNVLAWFSDEDEARHALAEMIDGVEGAELDLVAFEGPGRPVEPVSASARSAWPAARLVWSSQSLAPNTSNPIADWKSVVHEAKVVQEDSTGTDERVLAGTRLTRLVGS